MKSLRLLGVLLAGLVALAACSATPSPTPAPATSGPTVMATVVNGQFWGAPDHSVAIRQLAFADVGAAGYPAGANATVTMQLWNNSIKKVALTGITVAGSKGVVLVDGGSVQSTFTIDLPSEEPVTLTDPHGRHFEVRCLPAPIKPGQTLQLQFHFSNGQVLTGDVWMAGHYIVTVGPAPTAGPKPTC
jgi:copper(I)-binding protein